VIPLYGFLEGDTLGLVVLARPEQSMAELAAALALAARVRVAPAGKLVVKVGGQRCADTVTVADAKLAPLDRFDVVHERDTGAKGAR
jgi:hypothetical protein